MMLRTAVRAGWVALVASLIVSACGADLDETCGGLCVEPDGSTTSSADGSPVHAADGASGTDSDSGLVDATTDTLASDSGSSLDATVDGATDSTFEDVEVVDATAGDDADEEDAPDDGDFVDVEIVDGGLDGDDDDSGSCSPNCMKGSPCSDNGDCSSGHCHQGTCR